jgi:dUTP pyrophosphatase
MTELYFAKTRTDATIPSKRGEDAGYDIYSAFDAPYIIIAHSETVLIPTGIASEFHKDYYLQLHERGSLGD